MQGKIIKGIAGFYYVHDGHSRIYECKAKGIFRNQKIKPMVGDNVTIEVLSAEENTGNIEEILPRKNQLIRPAVANIDQAIAFMALKEPTPNFHLLDRFLIMMESQSVPCLIVFNKADLKAEKMEEKALSYYKRSGYQFFITSTYSGQGIDEVKQTLNNKTTVLAGPSGVGKSSFTNYLIPEAEMETGGVSKKIGRGRHTTRHTEIFHLQDQTFLMDTPGFTSLLAEDFTCEELKEYVPEFVPINGRCKFNTCNHVEEPDCLVKEAVKEGKISEARYQSYVQLFQEIKEKRRY